MTNEHAWTTVNNTALTAVSYVLEFWVFTNYIKKLSPARLREFSADNDDNGQTDCSAYVQVMVTITGSDW